MRLRGNSHQLPLPCFALPLPDQLHGGVRMETAKSKAKRHITGAYILVILIFVFPAIIGTAEYSLELTASSTLTTTSASAPITHVNTWSVYNLQGAPIPSSGNTFNLPTNTTSAVIVTDLTVGEAQNYTITKLVFNPSVNVNENIEFYFAIGTSPLNYTILYQINSALSVKNGTVTANPQISVPITPDYYSFPASYHYIFIIKNMTIGSVFSGNVVLYGSTNSAINIILSPQGAINIILVLLGIFALVLGIISMPWVEMHLDRPYSLIKHHLKTYHARRKAKKI
ncbi:MAG: hypothetical protein ACP5IB_10255, partial [Thermoplasmata archaeon]